MRTHRWRLFALIVLSLAFLIDFGPHLFEDRRIGLSTLMILDPPPSPAVFRLDGHMFSVTGALVLDIRPEHLTLRAWAPTPTIQVIKPNGDGQVTLRVENLPRRVHLDASGPVDEDRQGLTRILHFTPQGTHHLAFTDPEREVTFAVLGDTGDSAILSAALRLAASAGADFLIHVGDLIYRDEQVASIAATLATSPLPVFVVRGNHDYRNQVRINFMHRLAPPYYAFQMGGATFIILDNGEDYVPTFWRRSTQYRWLTDTLRVARDGPLFVAMHIPPFDPRTGPQRAPMRDKAFAQQLMRDFVQAGVDAVLTGHVHASYTWVRGGIPYVVSGEGFSSPEGPSHLAWVQVRGGKVTISHIPIWQQASRPSCCPDCERDGMQGCNHSMLGASSAATVSISAIDKTVPVRYGFALMSTVKNDSPVPATIPCVESTYTCGL
jgi:predicted phosphodiesterase